jgi:hypothetical protein
MGLRPSEANEKQLLPHFSPVSNELSSRPERRDLLFMLSQGTNSTVWSCPYLAIPTEANPDFLPRAASKDHVCGPP